MYALRQELVSPSGVEHSLFLNLTPSCVSSPSHTKVVANLVVARSNLLRIFEVREEAAPLPSLEEVEVKANAGASKAGTEAVEGEVEMDQEGEGFINMAQVKSLPAGVSIAPSTVSRLYLLREHRLHGIVTGLGLVKTLATKDDGLDRLLISFKDAKISLMEWSDYVYDITTLSIHTYERTTQVLTSEPHTWRAVLRMDPSYRCAALSLPKESFAIIPFHTPAELEMLDQERKFAKDVPYAASFVLDMADVDSRIKNIIDYTFIPGFNNPTLAIAFQTTPTWTARLNELKDTVSIFLITIDAVTRSYPVISQIHGMPYDVQYIVPCPASLGGLLLVTSNAILHADQSSRTVGIAVSGWANRVSSVHFPVQHDENSGEPLDLKLEGSRMTFVKEDANSILFVLADGTVRKLTLHMEGRSISKLDLSGVVGQTVPATTLSVHDASLVLVGSTAGPSILLRATHVEQIVERKTGIVPVNDDDADIELDEEIYGDLTSQAIAANTQGPEADMVTSLKLSYQDALPGHGIISDMTFGISTVESHVVPELIACTGAEAASGFTSFSNHIPTRTKRKLPAIGGSQGIWSIRVKRSSRSKGNADLRDTIVVSTNISPAPGLSRVLDCKSNGEFHVLSRTPGVTVAAGAFFQNTRFVQVMHNTVRLMDADGRERSVVKDTHVGSKIVEAGISDPHILVRRDDGSASLFVGDTMKGKIAPDDRVELPTCTSISLFSDREGTFRSLKTRPSGDGETDEVENVLDSDRGASWVLLLLSTGEMQLRSLPDLALCFAYYNLSELPQVILQEEDRSMEGEAPLAESQNIDQVCIASFGEGEAPKTCLVALTSHRILVVYDVLPPSTPSTESTSFRMVKTLTHVLPEPAAATLPRALKPFTTTHGDLELSGLICTGAYPFWLLRRSWSPIRVYPAAHLIINAFTSCSIVNKGDFLVHSNEGTSLIQWPTNVQFGLELPYRNILAPRQYSSILFDPTSNHILAVSVQKSRFAYYDEEGRRGWQPDAPGIDDPVSECSALELLSPDTWLPIDGYEFALNEFVNVARSVSLETTSTEAGVKDFVVVGTTIYRGEDLAVKGATYIFEAVEVVTEPSSLKRRHKLKILCRDETKGPVSAVCGLNGYLVSSMGQKIYVRAFDLDERLIGMAFLDVGLYVTSLNTVKNFLLIGDAAKSIWFVCFQEDPFKLIVIAKDQDPLSISAAHFFFGTGNELSLFVTDEDGVIRLFDYDPLDPDSNNGQRLLCRSEFDTHSEQHTVIAIARGLPGAADEGSEEELVVRRQSILLSASVDGSISVVTPVEVESFKRLSLLQVQLIRNVQHVAGLNPKAFRTVRNEKVSRPLTKGILDATLLDAFSHLAAERQAEATKQIGTVKEVILGDLRPVWRAW